MLWLWWGIIWFWSKQVFTNGSKFYQSCIFRYVLSCPFLCHILGFLIILNVQPKYRELTFECVYLLPEMWHQAFCDILGPPAVNQLYLLCQWYSQTSGFNKSIEVNQFGLKAFWHSAILLVVGNGKVVDTLDETEQGLRRLCKILTSRDPLLEFRLLSIWSTFSCPWFESCQYFDEYIKAEIFTKD